MPSFRFPNAGNSEILHDGCSSMECMRVEYQNKARTYLKRKCLIKGGRKKTEHKRRAAFVGMEYNKTCKHNEECNAM
jgi:hypothetical protein